MMMNRPKIDKKQRLSLLTQPIRRIMMAGFVLVAVVPLLFLGVKLYDLAWDESWREITEKHQLLAQNLASPISLYIEDQRASLGQLDGFINYAIADGSINELGPDQREAITQSMHRLQGFRSVSVVNADGKIVISTRKKLSKSEYFLFQNETCFVNTRKQGRWFLSGVKPSPFDKKPAVIMSVPLLDRYGLQTAVVMGELRIDLLEALRKKIRFGQKGHSAILDQNGRVLAHPNPEWMAEMRDLSAWDITRKMMRGETGVTEFYSPFIKANMVAGYATVPGINWGIMVPQPRPEVEARVNRILYAQMLWMVIGLVMALIIAYLLTRWISTPLKRMSVAINQMVKDKCEGGLPIISGNEPLEIRSLRASFEALVGGLQEARRDLDEMNQTLQQRVFEATSELRVANKQLQTVASQDYLTRLYNRRYFESTLLKKIATSTETGACLSLIMIDIDNFKLINDQFGHAAGDHVLICMANILREQVGEDHLIARYAGDEFLVLLEKDLDVAEILARKIVGEVGEKSFYWEDEEIRVTVSIGLYQQNDDEDCSVDSLLQGADQALYHAKEDGRNRVSVTDR